jgi:NarL family two-component system sensor histidine kinase YdfH
MMKNSKFHSTQVESDPRYFVWFMTVIAVGVTVLAVFERPDLQRWDMLALIAGLLTAHLILHWRLERLAETSAGTVGYILVQSGLALALSWLTGHIGLASALFMALLGEAIGLYGWSLRSLFSGMVYLILLVVVIQKFSGWISLGWLLLAILVMGTFVVVYVTLYMRQNTAREQAQQLAAELEAANRQLAQYAAEVEDLTIADERQRMARELHDTLSQGLAGIILQLEAVQAHLASGRTERAQTIISSAMQEARATLADARSVIDDLRSAGSLNLADSLRREAQRFTNASGVPCECRIQDIDPPAPISEALIRTAAEGLSNISRHAAAKQAHLILAAADQRLVLTIADDGCGFNPQVVPSGHYGLLGLRERVRMAGGQVAVESAAGQGTCLTVSFPWKAGQA